MYARFSTGRTSDEFPPGRSQTSTTVWYGGFDLTATDAPQQAVSSTRVALRFATALSVQRVRATAVITVPAPYSSEGTVTFLVDGKPVGTAEVSGGPHPRASLLLPRLPRGWHSVTAQFAGSPTVAPSSSLPARLRILL